MNRKFAIAKLARCDSLPCPIKGIDHLCIGSIGSIVNNLGLREMNITHTICVAAGVEAPKSDILLELGIIHCDFGVQDKSNVDISSIFEDCFNLIESVKDANGRVLVYCFQGKSRSVTIIAAYLMKYYGYNFISALDLIRETRPLAMPNLGFILILRQFERSLDQSKSIVLIDLDNQDIDSSS